MKLSVIASALLLTVSISAFARGPIEDESPVDEVPANEKIYESWCEGNRIMSMSKEGEIKAVWDCYQISEKNRCVEYSVVKGEDTIVNATCE